MQTIENLEIAKLFTEKEMHELPLWEPLRIKSYDYPGYLEIIRMPMGWLVSRCLKKEAVTTVFVLMVEKAKVVNKLRTERSVDGS